MLSLPTDKSNNCDNNSDKTSDNFIFQIGIIFNDINYAIDSI